MAQRLDDCLDLLRHTRWYTNRVLDHTDPARWFEMPGGVSHIAWQVGHLAQTQAGHLLARVAGIDPAHAIPAEWRALFDGGTSPRPDPAPYPSPDALRAGLDRVLEHALEALASLPPAELDAPPLQPHWSAPTRWHMIQWNVRHETLHCGQIGLLRRLLGDRPYR